VNQWDGHRQVHSFFIHLTIDLIWLQVGSVDWAAKKRGREGDDDAGIVLAADDDSGDRSNGGLRGGGKGGGGRKKRELPTLQREGELRRWVIVSKNESRQLDLVVDVQLGCNRLSRLWIVIDAGLWCDAIPGADRDDCREGYNCIAGVDEAGRGPLAGPVVVAAVVLPDGQGWELKGLDDSKRLSEKKRWMSVCVVLGGSRVSGCRVWGSSVCRVTSWGNFRSCETLRA
jgi:hypothetical protein